MRMLCDTLDDWFKNMSCRWTVWLVLQIHDRSRERSFILAQLCSSLYWIGLVIGTWETYHLYISLVTGKGSNNYCLFHYFNFSIQCSIYVDSGCNRTCAFISSFRWKRSRNFPRFSTCAQIGVNRHCTRKTIDANINDGLSKHTTICVLFACKNEPFFIFECCCNVK